MAFYVPHPQQSAAKAKIDGFQPSGQQHQPPSPSNTFDPSSLFFSGPVFPDPFRNPHAGSGSMDFTETLMSMMPNNGGEQNQQHNQANGQQQVQQQQAQSLQQQQQQQQQQRDQQQQSQAGQPGAPLNLNIPQNIFDMSHFASPLSAFQQQSSQQQQQQQQQQRNTPKSESVDSPASLHTGHGFFDNSGTQPQQSHNPFAAPTSIPSYLNTSGGHRPESPTVSTSVGSPSESGTVGPTSPFPTHASHARMHGHRSPSIGPTSHSRSRSRGATSRPPPTSRNGMVKTGGPKRQSISSTPEEPATALPPPNARPQAILIPSHPSHPAQQQQQQHHHAHHLSHEFTPHQLNSIGPHPISPLGIHSTQTAPSAWFVPSNGQAANGQGTVEPGSFGIQEGIQQSFGQAFQPRSLSLGPNPKPGTSASASVLAGSLGTVPVGAVGSNKSQQEMAMDAAAKQLSLSSNHVRAAILNEKRRRRRESHNAVERRRRDNINEKISELSTLLPESMLDPTGTNAGGAGQPPNTAEGLLPTGAPASICEDGDKETPAMKANKGIILRKSVEYIRYLQQLVRVQANRNRELESELAQYRGQSTNMDTSGSMGPGLGDPNSTPSGHSADPNSMNTFGMLDSLTGIDEDGMSMSGLVYSPEDTTAFSSHRLSKLPEDSSVKDGSPRSGGGGSEEEEERGRGVQRGRRGYTGNPSVSVGHGKGTLGVRDDSAELESAVSDGESRERMMD